jgi:hypothetical protein
MLDDWAFGKAITDFEFGPASPQSHQMESAFGFQGNVQAFLASGVPLAQGHQDFGLPGLFSTGLNPTAQFVGSYDYTFTRSGNTVLATVTNSTTAWSFFYHAPGLNPKPPTRQGFSPMGRINQTFRMVLTCS